jgi:hypothetical protein
MKMQTSIRLDADLWQAYRALCSQEHLRPSAPIEELLKLIVENGSPRAFLSTAKTAAKTQTDGVNAFARVLLNWHTHEKHFYHTLGNDETPVEGQLLEALKTVTDSQLRQQIEEALITK